MWWLKVSGLAFHQLTLKYIRAANNCPSFKDMMKIRYIGKRETYVEGMYGSKIEFAKNEVVEVDNVLGRKLLQHTDQYELGDKVVTDDVVIEPEEDEDPNQDVKDHVQTMTKQALIDFTHANFSGVNLNSRHTVDELRNEVIMYIDQYSVE